MSRQLDLIQEERTQLRHQALIRALEFELVGVVESVGGHLSGFSIKIKEHEVLMTLRASFDDRPMVSFVGSETLATTICKSVSEVRNNRVTWSPDKYAK